ncbi:hypothetical protein WR25_14597 [Diploscapter pachys]|uniref:Uncharacterized protein n=1 Tax=Diploscapter pachys TaxID=2018661 RepID=A0A2A2LWR8_9BILA|nr:hypothetical protein WR25_14597 [Diploscapter pachys]
MNILQEDPDRLGLADHLESLDHVVIWAKKGHPGPDAGYCSCPKHEEHHDEHHDEYAAPPPPPPPHSAYVDSAPGGYAHAKVARAAGPGSHFQEPVPLPSLKPSAANYSSSSSTFAPPHPPHDKNNVNNYPRQSRPGSYNSPQRDNYSRQPRPGNFQSPSRERDNRDSRYPSTSRDSRENNYPSRDRSSMMPMGRGDRNDRNSYPSQNNKNYPPPQKDVQASSGADYDDYARRRRVLSHVFDRKKSLAPPSQQLNGATDAISIPMRGLPPRRMTAGHNNPYFQKSNQKLYQNANEEEEGNLRKRSPPSTLPGQTP